MDSMTTIREALQKAIKNKEFTVAEIAIAAGCSRQHIYDILKKRTDITLGLAEKIAEKCGIRIEVKRISKKLARI